MTDSCYAFENGEDAMSHVGYMEKMMAGWDEKLNKGCMMLDEYCAGD